MCGGVIGSCLNSILVFSGPTDTVNVESMISSSVFVIYTSSMYAFEIPCTHTIFCFVSLVLTIPVLMSLLTTIFVSKHNIS